MWPKPKIALIQQVTAEAEPCWGDALGHDGALQGVKHPSGLACSCVCSRSALAPMQAGKCRAARLHESRLLLEAEHAHGLQQGQSAGHGLIAGDVHPENQRARLLALLQGQQPC